LREEKTFEKRNISENSARILALRRNTRERRFELVVRTRGKKLPRKELNVGGAVMGGKKSVPPSRGGTNGLGFFGKEKKRDELSQKKRKTWECSHHRRASGEKRLT